MGNEAIKHMKDRGDKRVEIVANGGGIASKDVFAEAKGNKKDITIGVTDENDKLKYSWTFGSDTINKTDMDIDLTINFDSSKRSDIKKHTGDKEAIYLEFSHHGELPGPATIKTYVGNAYKNGEKIYLYYYDEAAKQVLLVGNKPLEVKAGYVEYTITHCSTYFFMEEKMNDVKLDSNSLSDATVTVLDKEITNLLTETGTTDNNDNNNNNGDNDIILYIVIAVVVIAIIAGGAFIFIKKKNDIKSN